MVTKEFGKEDISLLIEDDAQEEDENSQFGTYIRTYLPLQYSTLYNSNNLNIAFMTFESFLIS